MTLVTQSLPTAKAQPEKVPPLRNGDRLTAEEFERRYDATPGLKKAELINGVVYMAPPVTLDDHGGPHFDIIAWLGSYRIATPGVRGGDNATLRLPLANRPQPDACLIILPSHGGQVQIDSSGYIVGAPELVAEVAATSASYDLHDKLDLYLQVGVREYLVWRVFDRAIDWFVLRGGQYERLAPTPDGLYKSEVLPGLWLDPAALMDGDMVRVAQVQQQGNASPEHLAFVARLQQAAALQPPAGGGP
ncbi:MAG TPA: Uma2 family endonuclease [Gemmataceae bacterium]|jgi:Uma2 family endonuclease|nr:Uma2 family endonuclease [Gemmataceae bacterium]